MPKAIIPFLIGSIFLYGMLYKTERNGRLGVSSAVVWGYGMTILAFLEYLGVEDWISTMMFIAIHIISAILLFAGIRISYIRGTDSHREAFKQGARSYGKFVLFCVGLVLAVIVLSRLGFFD